MPGKGKKAITRPITDYLEAEDDADGRALEDQMVTIETDSVATLQVIRQILTQEVGKIQLEVNFF